MGTFSKIKKYSKPSHEINEKIESLDLELKKTIGEAVTNSTTGVYNTFQYVDSVAEVPPTYENVPDTSGITGNNFVQNEDTNNNTGYNDISQLFNNNIGETPTPIIQTPPETPPGGSGLGWHNRVLNGEAVGYITNGNKFKQVLNPNISGGTNTDYNSSSYYGENYYTEMGLRKSFSEAYQNAPHRAYNMTPGTYIYWKCWIPFNSYGFGAFYENYTGIKKQDNEGYWGLGSVVIGITPNKYQSDPGSPYQSAFTQLLNRYGLGDPNYYPGPIESNIGDKWGLSPQAYSQLIADTTRVKELDRKYLEKMLKYTQYKIPGRPGGYIAPGEFEREFGTPGLSQQGKGGYEIAGTYDLIKSGQVPYMKPEKAKQILSNPKYQKLWDDDPDALKAVQRLAGA